MNATFEAMFRDEFDTFAGVVYELEMVDALENLVGV